MLPLSSQGKRSNKLVSEYVYNVMFVRKLHGSRCLAFTFFGHLLCYYTQFYNSDRDKTGVKALIFNKVGSYLLSNGQFYLFDIMPQWRIHDFWKGVHIIV